MARRLTGCTACSIRNWAAPAPLAGAGYSIADMAIFPWVRTHKAQQVDLQKFPHVQRWYNVLFQRPAVKRGLDLGKELRAPALTDEARLALFGQTAQSVKRPPQGEAQGV